MTRPFRRGVFSKIALAVTGALPPQQVTPEYLQQIVLALRGEWK